MNKPQNSHHFNHSRDTKILPFLFNIGSTDFSRCTCKCMHTQNSFFIRTSTEFGLLCEEKNVMSSPMYSKQQISVQKQEYRFIFKAKLDSFCSFLKQYQGKEWHMFHEAVHEWSPHNLRQRLGDIITTSLYMWLPQTVLGLATGEATGECQQKLQIPGFKS